MKHSFVNLLPRGGEVYYIPGIFSRDKSEEYFNLLFSEIRWKQEPIKIFGREIMQPRLTAWYGDQEKPYTYSGLTLEAHHWIHPLLEIKSAADPAFRGDPTKYNPEELFVASLSSCHMLWYLHLCADAGIIVEKYEDRATATMMEDDAKGGYFKEVVLHPVVVIQDVSLSEKAMELHERANKLCYIANSCNFPVKHVAEVVSEK